MICISLSFYCYVANEINKMDSESSDEAKLCDINVIISVIIIPY
jgi:hypothetical protein